MATHIITDITCGYNGAGIQSSTAYDWRLIQETYVSLINFFDTLTPIGVERIACNYGKAKSSWGSSSPYNYGVTGTGLDYWDKTDSAGPNSWVVYRWNNATVPFYMIMQWSFKYNGEPFGNAPGDPGQASHSIGGSQGGIGVQFVYRADGTNPWNGTMNNDGSDTKGSVCWISSPGDNNLYIFSRTNSINGTEPYATTKNYFMSFYHHVSRSSSSNYGTNIPTTMTTAIVDENNVFIANDLGYFNMPTIVYFGKFTPAKDISYVNSGSYLSIADSYNSSTSGLFAAQGLDYIFGKKVPETSLNARDGGIAHPNPVSGTVGFSMQGFINYASTYVNPTSDAYSNVSGSLSLVGTFQEHRPTLQMNEDFTNSNGVVGRFSTTDFLGIIRGGVPNGATFNSGTKICWTNIWSYDSTNPGFYNNSGYITPWVPAAGPPYQTYTREGRMFNT